MASLTIKDKTFGEGIPKICIPITGRTEKEIQDAAGRIAGQPHDVVEWRADYYENITDEKLLLSILKLLKNLLPHSLLLFTFRTKKEGGVHELSEEDYLKICRTAAKSGLIDLLDLELFTGSYYAASPEAQVSGSDASKSAPDILKTSPLKSLISLAHEKGCHVILSNHDFHKTPKQDELLYRLSLMDAMGADMAKLAVMPRCENDVLSLLAVTRKAADSLRCPVITMSMGKLGAVSRISGKLTGSCLTFGTAGEASAPGQLPARILKQILETLSV
ncbi:MAG: type I 3-dehydroquinate dehydratase [Lachnospiraceae bacterium]|nr:type I 3-dehydroquinate dehydratase [Lachnospiraceae bacterium]